MPKKTTAQLDAEIAEALSRPPGSASDAASAPTRAEFSGRIKRALRDLYGLKVKMRTIPTKRDPFIEAWIPWEGNSPPLVRFPADLRNAALDVVYGEAFERHRPDPEAGNARPFSISLKGSAWAEAFRRLGHKL